VEIINVSLKQVLQIWCPPKYPDHFARVGAGVAFFSISEPELHQKEEIQRFSLPTKGRPLHRVRWCGRRTITLQ
jgi:hypothetical protein